MDFTKKKLRQFQFFLFGPKITAPRAASSARCSARGQYRIRYYIMYIIFMARERKGGVAFMRCKSSRDQFTTLTIVLFHTHTQPTNYVWNFNCPTIWLLKTEQPLVLPPVQHPSYNSYYRSTRRIQLLFKRHLTTRSIIIKQTASFFSLPLYRVFIASFVFVVVVIITIVFMVKEQYNIIIIINKPEFMRVLYSSRYFDAIVYDFSFDLFRKMRQIIPPIFISMKNK